MSQPEYVRVTDAVKPRREYTILASQVTDAHEVLDKPATYSDGAPIPPKYSPAALKAADQTSDARASDSKSPTSTGQSAASKKEN